MGKAENATTRACLDWLALRGAFAWRNNTGAIRTDKRFIRYGHTGSPDILGVLACGTFIGVEVKAPLGPKGGKSGREQSKEQREFEREVVKRGGVYVVAHGLDDLIAAVEGR